jgi:hypothetical protein
MRKVHNSHSLSRLAVFKSLTTESYRDPPESSPSRHLKISGILDSDSDPFLESLELLGDVHVLDTYNLAHGEVTVSFYDIREAQNAHSQLKSLYSVRYLKDPNDNVYQDYLVLSPSSSDELTTLIELFQPLELYKVCKYASLLFLKFYDLRAVRAALQILASLNVHSSFETVEFDKLKFYSPSEEPKSDKENADPNSLHKFWKNDFYDKPLTPEREGSITSTSTAPSPLNYKLSPLSNNSYESPLQIKPRRYRNADKSQFVINLDAVRLDLDTRTTIMIKNIPNKYTQKMLLNTINRKFRGAYDFLYLPIDFKNRCNVGYAFLNFVHYSYIPDFYHEFDGKKWEKFNSEKICALAYARIQGRLALLNHFQTSSVMQQENSKFKPVILPSRNCN